MSKIFRIIIGLILCLSILIAAAYASREYWMGSLLIYSFSDSDDRDNLSVVPEEYRITNTNGSNCSEMQFYGYRMCLSWNDIMQQAPDGEVLTWVRFNDGPMIIAFDPDHEGDMRSNFKGFFENDTLLELPKKRTDELKSLAELTLTKSNYGFLEQTLNSTFEDYKFFTPFSKTLSDLVLLMNKIRVCRLATGVYSEKILSFQTEHVKGFLIIFNSHKDARFYDLYFFSGNKKYLKVTIFGHDGLINQENLDIIINSIKKI